MTQTLHEWQRYWWLHECRRMRAKQRNDNYTAKDKTDHKSFQRELAKVRKEAGRGEPSGYVPVRARRTVRKARR